MACKIVAIWVAIRAVSVFARSLRQLLRGATSSSCGQSHPSTGEGGWFEGDGYLGVLSVNTSGDVEDTAGYWDGDSAPTARTWTGPALAGEPRWWPRRIPCLVDGRRWIPNCELRKIGFDRCRVDWRQRNRMYRDGRGVSIRRASLCGSGEESGVMYRWLAVHADRARDAP